MPFGCPALVLKKTATRRPRAVAGELSTAGFRYGKGWIAKNENVVEHGEPYDVLMTSNIAHSKHRISRTQDVIDDAGN
jgi:hypothetical protein